MVYDPMANPFGDIISATKAHAPVLLELRLFDALAIEWHAGPLGEVSVRLVAQKLGGRRWSRWQLGRAERLRGPLGWVRARNGRLIERAVSVEMVQPYPIGLGAQAAGEVQGAV